jgi:hypothetical protein
MKDQWALALNLWEKVVKEFSHINLNAPVGASFINREGIDD